MPETTEQRETRPAGWPVFIYWALVILWAAFIFFMSAHTGSDLDHGQGIVAAVRQWLDSLQQAAFGPGVDAVSPVAHFLEYTVFGALMYLALRASGVGAGPAITAAVALAICAAYAATDEFHQYFVPDRACDPLDWVVDVAGSLTGALLSAAAVSFSSRRDCSKRSRRK